MAFFSIGYAEQERVEVTLVGSPADARTEGFDWIDARVQISVGGFTADVEVCICVSDIIRFKEELASVYEKLEGLAELKTIEDQFYVRIECDKLGHVQATGFLKGDFAFDNKLTFEIRYDQTLVWHTISEIDEALFELSPATTSVIGGKT